MHKYMEKKNEVNFDKIFNQVLGELIKVQYLLFDNVIRKYTIKFDQINRPTPCLLLPYSQIGQDGKYLQLDCQFCICNVSVPANLCKASINEVSKTLTLPVTKT